MQLPCKKRYIIGVVVIIFLLWKCSGPDDDEYAAQQRAEQAADAARYQANQDAIAQGQPQPYQNVPQVSQQPVIVQQQPERDHFWDYVLLHHMFNNHSQPTIYQPRTRTVTNVRNVTNVTNVSRSTPPSYTAKTTVKQPSSNWSQPSATARSYTVSAPKPSSMQTKTWATSSSKGWGSSTSYKTSSSSYSYKPSSSYRSSSSSFSRRR